MTPASSPAIRRRELGARLRAHRLASGLTVDDVAAKLLVSSPKISRIETAQRGVNLRDVRDLATLYRLPPDEIDALMRLARESQRRSSWQQYSNQISDYAELEEAAVSICDYESAAVPALMQTEPYARALAVGVDPHGTDERHDQAVEARLARQRSLEERATTYAAVVDEAALRRVVGSRDVMHEQLRTLRQRAELPNVTIQVIPFDAGAHPGMDSTFILLGFDVPVADLVYVEGLIGSVYLKSPTDITRYRRVFDDLRHQALSPARTLEEIDAIADGFATGPPS